MDRYTSTTFRAAVQGQAVAVTEEVRAGTTTVADELAALSALKEGQAYDPTAVAISGGTINGAAIGQTTPAAGAFTELTVGGFAANVAAPDAETLRPALTANVILPGDATESKRIDIPAVWRRYLGLGGGRAIIAVARATFTAPSDGHGSIELVLGTSVIAQTSAPIGASAVEITAAADITDLGGRNHFLLRVATRDLAGAGDTTVSGIAVGLAGDPLPNAGAAGPKDGSQFYFRDEDGALRTVSLGDLAAAVARLGGG